MLTQNLASYKNKNLNSKCYTATLKLQSFAYSLLDLF